MSQWMAFVWAQHKAPAGSHPELSRVAVVDVNDDRIERILRSPRPNPKVESHFQATWNGEPDPEIAASGNKVALVNSSEAAQYFQLVCDQVLGSTGHHDALGNLDHLVPERIRALVIGPRYNIRRSIVISLRPKLTIDTLSQSQPRPGTNKPNPSPFGPPVAPRWRRPGLC